jgi:thioredoxin 1
MDLSKGKYILEFYSERCVACKTVESIMDRLMKEYGDIKLVRIDVRRNRDIAKKFGVIALPVLIFIKDGVEVDRIKGAKTEKELRDFIERNR